MIHFAEYRATKSRRSEPCGEYGGCAVMPGCDCPFDSKSAAPRPKVERSARPAPTVTRLAARGRAEATLHSVGCVCQACLEVLDAELCAGLREGKR